MAKNFRGTIYYAVDGTRCSAIRYQEKYDYSLISTLCICNIGKITCKNVQNHFIFFLIYVVAVYVLPLCTVNRNYSVQMHFFQKFI